MVFLAFVHIEFLFQWSFTIFDIIKHLASIQIILFLWYAGKLIEDELQISLKRFLMTYVFSAQVEWIFDRKFLVIPKLFSNCMIGSKAMTIFHGILENVFFLQVVELPRGSIAKRCQFFRLGLVFGFWFLNQLLPRFLHRFLFGSQEPSLVWFSIFKRSQEASLVFPLYPWFLSIFVDIPWLSRCFPCFFLETPLVYFQVYFRIQEPSSVRFSVLSVKNLSSVYVTVYFREYKYRPYDSVIGLYRLGVVAGDRWHMTHDTSSGMNILSKFQL